MTAQDTTTTVRKSRMDSTSWRSDSLTKKKVSGVPDLLIEVLSPSSRSRDMRVKKGRYERAGVAEYWIVNWKRKAIEQFVLCDGKYDPADRVP